jgi:hypothetical protein
MVACIRETVNTLTAKPLSQVTVSNKTSEALRSTAVKRF